MKSLPHHDRHHLAESASLLLCLWLFAGIAGLSAQGPLTTMEYTVTGQVMEVTPSSLSVPKGIAGSVGISIPGEVPSGAFVEAILRGPSFPARRLVGAANAPLLLPPLNLSGDYSLDAIRLVSAGGETLLEGTPSSVPVRVFDEVLVSRVTSRPLSLDEIQERGIEIDDTNFRAVEFEVGFVVDGQSFPVRFPVIAPGFRQSTEIIPAAELEERLAEVERLNQQIGEAVGLPPELERVMPNIQVKGINMQFGAGGGDDDLALRIPPIPALMVIPGNIGFLNQFFSVMVFTENAAPAGSGLTVHSLTAELILPPGPDQVRGTHESPGDDPLRMARVNGEVRSIVPVRHVGPDGIPGTADDVDRLRPGDTGQGELLVEGLQEGLHVMELALKARLDGLAAGSVEITGKAAGSILVRNPKFSMAFVHPRTVRSGEPYEAAVTILNTSSTVANLVSIELNENNVSGGVLESDSRVELGNIAPGETKTATFRIRSQKTGAITFSNLTTSDDSLVGRFRLRTGVDERGVTLSSDTLVLPDFIDSLPPDLLAAAQRVLGQAISTNTAGQLPPGVQRVAKRMVAATSTMDADGKVQYRGSGTRLMELLEAAQRLRYGEPLARVLPDLLLDWQGARDFDPGWDQLVRETDAGREWREALMRAMENADPTPDHAVTRLVMRGRDLAGRGEAWLLAASDRGGIDLEHRGAGTAEANATRSRVVKAMVYGGADGDWLAAAQLGLVRWRVREGISGVAQFSVMLIGSDGQARELLWAISDLPAGAVVVFDPNAAGEVVAVDENGDGTPERTVAATGTDFTELPPQVLVVMQDAEVRVGRPSKPCLTPMTTNDRDEAVMVNNYANILAVLFSKPMTQETANVPGAYRFENGNEAAFVQMQPGGRVALLTMRQPLGALIPRALTVTGSVTDTRGNPMASSEDPVFSRLVEGVSVKGRVIRADGSYAANVPVTLTYNDEVETAFGCEPWTRRTSQVRTDENGGFKFDFVIGNMSYTLSATDTSSLSEEAINLILQGSVKGEVDGQRLTELANQPQNQNTLLAQFATASIPAAIAMAEGLDRAAVTDSAQPGRFGSESVYALRFRGRCTVTGQVVLADGQTPAPGAAVNLFPDVNSRELGRGIVSDSAGRFAFHGVPLGPFSIEAFTSTGLTRTVSGLVDTTGGSVDVLISLGATPPSYADWQGRVTEADGSAVAGAPVYVGQMHMSGNTFIAIGQTVADASGYWSIPQVPVGTYQALAFSLDGKRKGTRGPLTSVANTVTTANVVLQSRAVVEGVVRFANGDPVEGAVVGGGDRLVTTDSLGRFTLPGVPTGPGTISAGFVGIEGHVDPRKQLTRIGSSQVNVQTGENFVVIQFHAVGRIIGTLRDAAGQPMPNTNVALPFPFEGEPYFLWVKSDAQGRYEFPGLALKGPISGAYDVSAPAPPVQEPFDGDGAAAALLTASAEEIAAIIGEAFAAFTGVNNPLLTGGEPFNPNVFGFQKAVRLNFDGATEVADITFLGPSKISGTVLNGQGVPIGARVRLTGIGPSSVGYPTFITRAERNSDPALGTFEFDGQAFIGDWGLQAASPFFPVVISTSGRTTSIDPDATGIVLQFPPVQEINGSLTGVVLLPDGSPAGEDVEVSISASSSDDPRVLRTDAEGRFTTGAALFSLRGNTSYTVTAFDPATGGQARSSVYVNAGQDNALSITLLGRGDLEVLVLRADGSPAAGAAVEAKGGQFPNEKFDGVADSQGRIVFSNLYAGPFGVCAEQTIGLTRTAGRVGALVVNNQNTSVTVTLSSTATVTGLFVEADGVTPVAGANVRLGSLAFAPTDSQGRFIFPDVPLGTHVLTAVNPVSGRGGNTTATLSTNGQTVDVRIVEATLGVVSGLVLNAEGIGVEVNAEVELRVDDPFALTRLFKVTTGPDGAYSVAGVVPGGFTVSARSRLPNGQPGNDSGSVRAVMPMGAASVNVDVPMNPRGTIEVLVMRPDGVTPAANARVVLLFSNVNVTRDADADGVVVFPGLGLSSSYSVQALDTTPGETSSRSRIHNVPLTDRGQVVKATLTLRGTGAVQGVVFEADGTTPAAGAEVRMQISRASEIPVGATSGARTDQVTPMEETMVVGPDGEYSFGNLPTGLPVMLRATRLGLAAAETVASVSKDQTVTRNLLLTASGTVMGRVLREDGTTLAVGTEVVVEFPSRSGAQGAILRIADAEGRFEISPVPEGPWTLRAVFPVNGGLALAEGAITTNGEVDDLGDLILDETFPTVVSTVPEDSDDSVDINSPIEVIFSEPMKAASVNATGVFVRPAAGGAAVPATLSQPEPHVVIITPTSPLQSETTYQMIVVDGELKNALGQVTNTGPQDLVGRPLLGLFSATFTTRDQRPPELLSFTPADDAIQVEPQSVIRLSFDEPIQPGAVVTLTGPGGPVAGTTTLGVNNLVLTFVPTTPLPVNASFTATVSGVQDLAGNAALDQPFVSTFATLDTLGPEIAELRIKGGSTPVAGAPIILEAVLATPETGARYRLSANAVTVGTSAEDVLEVPFTLPASGTIIFRGIGIDRFGNEGPLSELSVSVQPNAPPVVEFVRLNPLSGPIPSGSAFGLRVEATDDSGVADLRAAATGAATVSLRSSTGDPVFIQGTMPSTAVPGSKLRVLASAIDTSGVSSGEQVFEIEVSDASPPVLAVASPAANTVVPPGEFALEVDWRDNSGAADLTVSLSGLASGSQTRAVTGTPNVNGREAFNFDLSEMLPIGGTFTATVSATDAAGITASVSRAFVVPDLTPPQITQITPSSGAAQASLWTEWRVDFDETRSDEMVNTANYRLVDSAGVEIPLTVSLFTSPISQVHLIPASVLAPGEEYTFFILPGVTDAAGNIAIDPDGNPLPEDGLALTLTTASLTLVAPADPRIVPGQMIEAEIAVEAGVGTTNWQFAFNDDAYAATEAVAGGHRQALRLDAEAEEAVFRIRGVSAVAGRPDYFHPEVMLDVRPRDEDDDGDGWLNGFEVDRGMNPFVADLDDDDFDGDGLTNGEERLLGTDPGNPDSDGDGLLDGDSINVSIDDPRYEDWASTSIIFTQGTGERRFLGEREFGTDPLNPDTDGDGIPDGIDPFPLLPNRPPVPGIVTVHANSGLPQIISEATVLADASDPDGDGVLLTSDFEQPANGTVTFNEIARAFTYTSDGGFSGEDSFTYTLADEWGLTATGTVVINVGANRPPIAGVEDPFSALRFAGGDGRITLPNGLVDGSTQISVEIWFRAQPGSAGGVLFGYQGNAYPSSPAGWVPMLYLGTDGRLRGEYWFNSVNPITSSSDLRDGEWHHAVLVGAGDTQSLWLNGELVGTRSGAIIHLSMVHNQIGTGFTNGWPASPGGWFSFEGSIHSVRIWHRPLDSSEIESALDDPLMVDASDLVAWYASAAGIDPEILDDVSGNGLHGFIAGTGQQRPQRQSQERLDRFRAVVERGTEGQALLVTLEGSDPDGDPLTAIVRSLPANGALFQFSEGALGDAITTVPTLATDPARRIVYVSGEGFSRADSFLYSVDDGQLDSDPALALIQISADVPPTSDDVWDVSQGAVVTAHSGVFPTSNIENIFGGTGGVEHTNTVFADGQPAGFTHFVEWETDGPIWLEGFRLFAINEAVVGNRGITEMRLFGRSAPEEDFALLATHTIPANPYFPDNLLRFTGSLPAPFVGQQFRAEFDQFGEGTFFGPRIVELDAIGWRAAQVLSFTGTLLPLQNATSDNTQSGFSPSAMIDGIVGGPGTTNGWAGATNLGTISITAVVETVEDVIVDTPDGFVFELIQPYGSEHFLGRFRLSATTDSRNTFADGLAIGGNITADWTVLDVLGIESTGGETFTVLEDGSILVSGNMPSTTTYRVLATGITGAVTGFRLEALEHPSLPSNGPGRVAHGNWVLSEFRAYLADREVFNRYPLAADLFFDATAGEPLFLSAAELLESAFDPDGDPLSLVFADFGEPGTGLLEIAAGGSGVTYTAPVGFGAIDSFTYTVRDNSGLSATATVFIDVDFNRAPIARSLLDGYALAFNGSGGEVDLGNPEALRITGDQTIEMWLKPADFNQRRNPWAKAYAGEGTITQETDGRLNYFYGNQGNNSGANGVDYQSFSSIVSLPLDQWTHVAVVRDLTNGVLRWYFNGNLVSEADTIFPAAVAGSLPAYIGRGYVQRYAGEIDEVRVWHVARTPEEIAADYKRVLEGSQPGLAGYWRFNEGGGSQVFDASPNALTGTLGGGVNTPVFVPSFVPYEAIPVATADTAAALVLDGTDADGDALTAHITQWPRHGGLFTTSDGVTPEASLTGSGNALLFEHTRQTVELPHEILDGSEASTVEFWMRTRRAANQALLSGANSGNDNAFLIFLPNATTVQFVNDAGASNFVQWTVVPMFDGEWRHLSFVRDPASGGVELFINGESQGFRAATLPTISIDPGGLWLAQEQDSVGGDWDANQNFRGYMDEFRVWDHARAPSAIAADWNRVLNGNESGLVAYYPMDTLGNVLLDRSGNGLHGTLTSIGGSLDGSRPLTTVSSAPTHGGLPFAVPDSDGRLVYVPEFRHRGFDEVGYRVFDGRLFSEEVYHPIFTDRPLPGPVAVDAAAIVQGGAFTLVNPFFNDYHPLGRAFSVEDFTQPDNGTVEFADGRFVYTPATAFSGEDTFTYRLSDGLAQSEFATVTLLVTEPDEIRWTNPAGGNFNTAENWSAGRLPLPDEVAIIDLEGTYTVTISANATLGQLRVGGPGSSVTLRQTGGFFTVTQTSRIQPGSTYEFSGGAVEGTGTLIIEGHFAWTGGTMRGAGKTVIAAGASGTISGTANRNLESGRILENAGSLFITAPNIYFNLFGTGGGAVINNLSGGVMETHGAVYFRHSSVSPGSAVNNAGLFRKTGAGMTRFSSSAIAFNNSGRVEIEAGSLRAEATASLGGEVFIESGASLNLVGSQFALEADVGFSGAGPLVLESGTLRVDSDIALPIFTQTGGTLRGLGTVTVTDTFAWTGGGDMRDAGKTVIAAGATGTISGTGNRSLESGRVLENAGSLLITAPNLWFNLSGAGGGAVINNLAGAVLETSGGTHFRHNAASPGSAVNNAGLFRKTGTGSTQFSSSAIAFNNTGTVEIVSGILRADAGGQLGGSLELQPGAILQLGGGNFSVSAGSAFVGTGTIHVDGGNATFTDTLGFEGAFLLSAGTANFSVAQQFASFTQTGGTLRGLGTVTVTDTFAWTGGDMRDAGKTVIAAGATGTTSGTGNRSLESGRVLENAGSLLITAPNLWFNLSGAGGGAVINNLAGAVLETSGGTYFRHNAASPSSAVNNAGLLRKTGSGTTRFSSSTIAFNNTGTVEMLEGSLQMDAGFTQSGLIIGSGSILASFTNNGILRPDPQPGSGLTISGNLTQGESGRIELTLAEADATLGHRSLTVTGSAALNGTLQVITDPAFNESDGGIIEVMSFASRSGNFATTEGLTGNPQFNFTPTLETTRLLLTVAAEETTGFAALATSGVDSDGDGLCDFLEEAFGGNPNDASCRRNPQLVMIDGAPALRHHERTDLAGFAYRLQYSTDLKAWHDADGADGRAGTVEHGRVEFCERTDAVTVALDAESAPAGNQQFLRLKVSWGTTE